MGIHINKSPAVWRNKFNQMNVIIPDRVDDDMPIFKASDDSTGATANILGTVQGAQYDEDNEPLTIVDPVTHSALDPTHFINKNNVILWHIQGGYDKFNKNEIFPVLYKTNPSVSPVLFKPIFFAMFPSVNYDPVTERVYLTFWSNVKEYAGGEQESFTYRPSYETTNGADKSYQIGSVISSDDITATTGDYRRALFACEGVFTKCWWNAEFIFESRIFNSGRNYYQQGTYIFNKPIIIFLPRDSDSGGNQSNEIVVDIGAGGGGGGQFVELHLDL